MSLITCMFMYDWLPYVTTSINMDEYDPQGPWSVSHVATSLVSSMTLMPRCTSHSDNVLEIPNDSDSTYNTTLMSKSLRLNVQV